MSAHTRNSHYRIGMGFTFVKITRFFTHNFIRVKWISAGKWKCFEEQLFIPSLIYLLNNIPNSLPYTGFFRVAKPLVFFIGPNLQFNILVSITVALIIIGFHQTYMCPDFEYEKKVSVISVWHRIITMKTDKFGPGNKIKPTQQLFRPSQPT